jgi:hypothetical protein
VLRELLASGTRDIARAAAQESPTMAMRQIA